MGRVSTNYGTAQQDKIRQLHSLHADFVIAKANMKAEIEAAYKLKLRDFELRESRLMNEALGMGIAKTTISAAVAVTNWDALSEKFALTAEEFFAVVEPEQIEATWHGTYGDFTIRYVFINDVRVGYNPPISGKFNAYLRPTEFAPGFNASSITPDADKALQALLKVAAQNAIDTYVSTSNEEEK
jgi:hypothetical protein